MVLPPHQTHGAGSARSSEHSILHPDEGRAVVSLASTVTYSVFRRLLGPLVLNRGPELK